MPLCIINVLYQSCQTGGPRAKCGPRVTQRWPTNHLRKICLEFYRLVINLNKDQFPKIMENAYFWTVQFGSTYVCEQSFSLMKLTKSKHRSRLTDGHLDCALRLAISPIVPNLDELVKGKRCQISGQK